MSYQAIARKYRPQTFDEVIGQEPIIRTLKNAVENDKVAHAYIFSGTRGVGKTTTARILAKALNCEQGPTVKPCGKCPPCTEIASNRAVDVIEIDAASNRGIDEIRELRETVRYLPARDPYKIFIIDEVHMLTTEAFNALLKTLEEPPERVIFVLATTEPQKIPATIHSRCQNFHFRTVSFQEILDRLHEVAAAEGVKVDKEALAILARGAEGSLRDSLSLLDQAIACSGKKVSTETVRELLGVVGQELLNQLIDAIREQSNQKALQLVDELVSQGHNLQHFCREALRHIRNLLLVRVGGEAANLADAAGEEREKLEAAAADFSEEDLLRYFNSIMRTYRELHQHPQPRLHLELGLLKLVQAGKLAPLEEVLAGLSQSPGAASAPGPEPGRPGSPTHARRAAPPLGSSPSPSSAPRRTEPVKSAAPPAEGPAGDRLPPDTVEVIKSAVYEASKFLGSLTDNVSVWTQQSDVVHLNFGSENKTLIEMIEKKQRDQLEKIVSRVLGQPTRVHLAIGTAAGAAANGEEEEIPPPEAAATHPTIEALVKTFGGRVRLAHELPGNKPGR